MQPLPTWAHQGASTRTPGAVQALLTRFGQDWKLVTSLVERFTTWSDLLSAPRTDLAHLTGGQNAALMLPPSAPPLPPQRDGVRAISRWEQGWPSRLTDLLYPPPLIYTAGVLPPPPYVTVGGPANPTPSGLEVARAAGEVCARRGLRLVVVAGDRTGEAAAQAQIDAGAGPVVLATGGIETLFTTSKRLLDQAVERGGAGLAVFGDDVWPSDASRRAAASVAATLGSAVVIAELGYHTDAGRDLAEAAIAAGRYLVVPNPEADERVPLTAIGGASLARARQFSETLFGTSPRIERRLAAGQSPADAVVSGPGDLEVALAYACGLNDTAPPARTRDGWVIDAPPLA